jgi:hypothetical protein
MKSNGYESFFVVTFNFLKFTNFFVVCISLGITMTNDNDTFIGKRTVYSYKGSVLLSTCNTLTWKYGQVIHYGSNFK